MKAIPPITSSTVFLSKRIKDEISDLERREREARIEALRRSNLLGDEDDDETGVVLLPPRREVDSNG